MINKVIVIITLAATPLALATGCGASGPSKTAPSATTATTTPSAGEQPAVESTPAEPAVKPQSYRGRGDKVLRIKDGDEIWLASLTHAGSSNFIVDAVPPGGGDGEGLVNAIGRYKGTVLFNMEEGSSTRAIKIKADGSWTVKLKPVGYARRWTGSKVSGKGDDVLAMDPPSSGLATATLKHSGESNFIVDAYTRDGDSEGLVNEIGRYSGEVTLPDGAFLFTVHAEGSWTITR